MRLSARNILPGTVKSVTPGAVDTEVVVELAPGIEVVSIISKHSAENLRLQPGANAYAIVKASSVMIGSTEFSCSLQYVRRVTHARHLAN
jgi:molybdopterin-binding protein